MNRADEPAFPNRDGDFVAPGIMKNNGVHGGLTKREYFAAMAMRGMLAAGDGEKRSGPVSLAMSAVEQADALLAELEKKTS